jgi:hypothetical protein
MASAPVYFATSKTGYARLTTGVVATDGSGASTGLTWYNTAPSADYMVTRLHVSSTSATGVGDLADSLLNIFVTDGTTERLFRTIDLGNFAAGTTVLPGGQLEIVLGPEFIFPSAVSLKFAISVTPTAGQVDIVAMAQML